MGKLAENLFGAGKRLGIKTDVYTPIQKNTSRGRKRYPSTVPANRAGGRAGAGGRRSPPTPAARSKRAMEKALLENRPDPAMLPGLLNCSSRGEEGGHP